MEEGEIGNGKAGVWGVIFAIEMRWGFAIMRGRVFYIL